MKRLYYSLAAFFLMPLAALQAETVIEVQSAPAKKGAVLWVNYSEYNFGTISTGEKKEFSFILRNTGGETLTIANVAVSADFLTAKPSSASIEPGKEARINVTINAAKQEGPVEGRILIHSNSQDLSQQHLKIYGIVKPIISLKPPLVFAGQLARTAPYSGRVEIEGAIVRQGALKDVAAAAANTAIKTKVVRSMNATGPAAFLEFTITPEFRAGSFRETIIVESKDPPARAELLLVGQKLGIIQVSPDRFYFDLTAAAPDVASIILECEKPFHITDIQNKMNQLVVTYSVLEKDKKYEVSAKLKDKTASFIGVVQIHTSLEENSLIDAPVVVIVPGKKIKISPNIMVH